MPDSIFYEQPLNERIRAFLRLEHLFSQVTHFQGGHGRWDSHATVTALIEMLTILDRTDIRSEILKELDRHISGLSRLLDAPNVEHDHLAHTLQALRTQQQQIQLLSARLAPAIKDNDLLNCVRQRTVITGGTCGFDIPSYHYWLNQPISTKTECLSRWVSAIQPLINGISVLLTLIRNSAFFETETAEQGFFQRSLDTQNPCQLLRIALPLNVDIYPEVSGNKHRVNVRFLTYTESGRPKQIEHPFQFEMSCCAI